MYNGNHTQLTLFRSATGVSFPLLQMAINGTVYGAFRDEMMVIDQSGKQTLIVNVRSDPNWSSKVTTEIDRLLELPVGRFLADDLILDSLQVGGSTMRTLLIVNDGKSSLNVQGASTDIEGLRVTLPGQTIAAGDTASIVLTRTST